MNTSVRDFAQSESAQSLTLGALAPLSRPGWVEAGTHLIAGLSLAVEEIHHTSGLPSPPLTLIVRDTGEDPHSAAVAVHELHHAGVAAIVVEYHSVAARAAAAEAARLQVPFLCSSAVLDNLTDAPSPWIARVAPPQSVSWRRYADFLLHQGHRRIGVITQPSIYWLSGLRILQDHFATHSGSVVEFPVAQLTPQTVGNELVDHQVSAVLFLLGYPSPAADMVAAVRQDPRLRALQCGAPAGQPEFHEWLDALGDLGTAIPFLRYRTEQLTPLGNQVETVLTQRLGHSPSFVALEGYDTVLAISEMLRHHATDADAITPPWGKVEIEGTRGQICFSYDPRNGLWQGKFSPIHVVQRASTPPHDCTVLYAL